MKLTEGQDITTIALNEDNTNLLVSTANKQLIIFTDPSVSCICYQSVTGFLHVCYWNYML